MSQSPVFCTLFQNQKRLGHFALARSASLHELTSIIRRSFSLSTRNCSLRTEEGEEISSDRILSLLLRNSTGAVRFYMSPVRDVSGLYHQEWVAKDHSVAHPKPRLASCGNCKEEIEGVRFRCLHCPVWFELCSACEAIQCRTHFHPKAHLFAKICNSSQTLNRPLRTTYSPTCSLYVPTYPPRSHSHASTRMSSYPASSSFSSSHYAPLFPSTHPEGSSTYWGTSVGDSFYSNHVRPQRDLPFDRNECPSGSFGPYGHSGRRVSIPRYQRYSPSC